MLPKTRLGKRSPLGALLSSTCPTHTHLETGETDVTMATAAGQHFTSMFTVYLNVYCLPPCLPPCLLFTSMFTVYLHVHCLPPCLFLLFTSMFTVYFHVYCLPPCLPPCLLFTSMFTVYLHVYCLPSCSMFTSMFMFTVYLHVYCLLVYLLSCSQQRPQEVDMDELMAAMVLSSLSCSPLLHSPTHPDTTAIDCSGSDFSDSGSSGYWSVGHAPSSPMPSPPIAEPDAAVAPPTDEGLDMELEQVLFDEPAPRKRRNSVKAVFRCLWPSCGKVLTSVVGIKRHIRTTHLCRGGEHERCSRSEEDFYYTEINQWEQPLRQSPPTPPLSSAPSSSGSLWQVQSEHSYQAPPPPGQMMSAAALATPTCPGTAPPTTCHKQGLSFRVRSVSVGEQWLQHQSAPCSVILCIFPSIRRVRGEAKKCRKVYGIEHREQWCTACRWKKACQRFTD
uniref:Zinc finger protein 395a n=1 Tax=Amphiprion percula TaxID=161767 RepID=A0A3P8RL46_AMPPE